jgi:hypothetical protein
LSDKSWALPGVRPFTFFKQRILLEQLEQWLRSKPSSALAVKTQAIRLQAEHHSMHLTQHFRRSKTATPPQQAMNLNEEVVKKHTSRESSSSKMLTTLATSDNRFFAV